MARSFARGAPPPPGSFEYLMVADHWYPDVHARKYGKEASSETGAGAGVGADKDSISYTDLDAAENYVAAVDRSVRQARQVHGETLLQAADEEKWDGFLKRWRPFAKDLHGITHYPSMLVAENKRMFDALVKEAHDLHDDFARKGMSEVPVPYAGELLMILRSMPKRLTAAQMRAKLEAGARCGDRLLDENTTWWSWVSTQDHLPLKRAVKDARTAAYLYGRSRLSDASYGPGDPVYDEFLRRLTKIWIEAAGLYGIRATKSTARAELKDDLPKMPRLAAEYALGLLAAAGVAYLGSKWLFRDHDHDRPAVAVPDAYPQGE